MRNEDEGYMLTQSFMIRHGLSVWMMRERHHLIVRYPILLVFSVTVLFLTATDNFLNLRETTLFGKILDYTYSGGSLLFLYTLHIKRRKIREVSVRLDQGWSYLFLEEEQKQLKNDFIQKVEKLKRYFYNPVNIGGGIGYCLIPFGRYLLGTDQNTTNLTLFKSWTPFPPATWWGFSLTYFIQLVAMFSLFLTWNALITYLMTAMENVASQFRLVGVSLVTANVRVLKIVMLSGLKEEQRWGELYTKTLQKELVNTIRHYHVVYRLAKEACNLFPLPINICYYSGMFAMVLSCGKLATERRDSFVLFQAFVMTVNVLINQFIVSWINQILTDQAEGLRTSVYDSGWYQMPVACRKTILMIQKMVAKPPSITTLMGAKADMVFFAKVVNTSYFYLSALLSMNIKY